MLTSDVVYVTVPLDEVDTWTEQPFDLGHRHDDPEAALAWVESIASDLGIALAPRVAVACRPTGAVSDRGVALYAADWSRVYGGPPREGQQECEVSMRHVPGEGWEAHALGYRWSLLKAPWPVRIVARRWLRSSTIEPREWFPIGWAVASW